MSLFKLKTVGGVFFTTFAIFNTTEVSDQMNELEKAYCVLDKCIIQYINFTCLHLCLDLYFVEITYV